MTRTKAKVDNNQAEIVALLRARGFQIVHTHMMGRGFPDLIVNKHGRTNFVEIKDGPKADYTEQQLKFYKEWEGSKIYTLRTDEEALKFES